jgi:fructokinase
MPADPSIVCFGEVLWDLLPTGPVLGGAPFNLAYRTHTLGHPTFMVSRLGRDARGVAARERVAALGLETAFLQQDSVLPTGTVSVRFDQQGNHDFTITPDVAYDHIAADPELLTLVRNAEALCFGTLARRGPGSRATLARMLAELHGQCAFLDLNLRKDGWTDAEIVSSIADAGVLKLNDQELAVVDRIFGLGNGNIASKVASLIRMTRLACLIVTLGPGGAFAAKRDGTAAYEPGFEVTVVDTIGSGDAFSAGFLHQYLRGTPLAESCRYGNALGALVTGQRGGTQPLSTAEIEKILLTGKRSPVDPRFD